MVCIVSCIGAVGREDVDGDGSCCITAVGCWSVIFAIDPTLADRSRTLALCRISQCSSRSHLTCSRVDQNARLGSLGHRVRELDFFQF